MFFACISVWLSIPTRTACLLAGSLCVLGSSASFSCDFHFCQLVELKIDSPLFVRDNLFWPIWSILVNTLIFFCFWAWVLLSVHHYWSWVRIGIQCLCTLVVISSTPSGGPAYKVFGNPHNCGNGFIAFAEEACGCVKSEVGLSSGLYDFHSR